MKILRIHITNIASLTDAEIDFEHGPLASDPIFLITGPTGAGKSTILNSICLALYNKCPALAEKNRTDRDYDNMTLSNPQIMIRKGVKAAEISLEFVGNDARRYVALWRQTRVNTRKKKDGRPAEVKYNASRILIDIASGAEEALTNDRTEALTGLTYEQFTRTTLLAQGQFARFLVAPGEDKARILEKITGTDIYSTIGARIALKYHNAANELVLKKEALKSMRLLSDEEIETRSSAIAALEAEIKRTEAKASELQTQINWLNRLNELDSLLDSHRAHVAQLQAQGQSAEYLDALTLVARFDATSEAREMITREKDAEKRLKDLNKECSVLKRDSLPGLFGRLDALSSDISKKNHRKALLEEKIREGEPMEDAFAKAEVVADISTDVKTGLESISGKEKQIDELTALADTLIKNEQDSAQALELADKALAEARTVVENFKERKAKIDLKALTAELTAPKEILRHITEAETAGKTRDEAVQERNRIGAECDQLRRSISDYEEEIKNLGEARPELEITYKLKSGLCDALSSLNDKISEIREGMAASDSCPLCGTPHAHFVGDEVISAQVLEARADRDKAKEALDGCDEQINRARAAVTTNSEILKSRNEIFEKKKKEAADAQEAFTRDFSDVDLSDEEVLAKKKSDLQARIDRAQLSLDEALEVIKQADEAQTTFQQCETDTTKARTAAGKAAEALRANTSQLTVLHTEIKLLRDDIAAALKKANEILPKAYAATVENLEVMARDFRRRAADYTDAKKEIDSLVTSISELKRVHGTASDQLSQFDKDRMDLSVAQADDADNFLTLLSDFLSAHAAVKALIDEGAGKLNECRAEIDSFIAENPDLTRDILVSLNERAESIKAMRENIKARDEALIQARAGVTTVEGQLNGHLKSSPEIPEGATAESLKIILDADKAKIDADKGECVRIRTELANNAVLRAESEERIREITALESRTALWKQLNELLGTNNPRFRNVAQSYVLRTLLAKANCYLRTFSSRYSLTARPGSLTISVLDNEWPTSARAANSLSGGESFIVSLALALALASISREKINVDTLFIDEGFGSLDPESLSMIIDALDTLYRIGGRRIGIISHVEVLKERIPTQIRLSRRGGNSSTLSIVNDD